MNISQARERSQFWPNMNYNKPMHGKPVRLDKVAVNVPSDSVTKVSISQEAREAANAIFNRSIDGINCFMNMWDHELVAVAIKNGSSLEATIREHGMEIAEYIAKQEPSGAFGNILDGIAHYINGESLDNESLKEAFKEFVDENLDGELGCFDARLEDLKDHLKGMRGASGAGVYSHWLGSWVFIDECKPNEDDNKEVPQDKSEDDEAQQDKKTIRDKKAIFKDFAERLMDSFHKKENSIVNEYIKIGKATKKKGSGISKEHIRIGKKYT
jgi:hypothetical protein